MSADEKMIRDLVAAWIDATRKGNVDAVLALMATDVIFLVPGQAPMVGHDAFAASLRGVLAGHDIEPVSEIDEVAVSGDIAYCRTRLSVTVRPHGGLHPPVKQAGYTLSVFRKQREGHWLLSRDANMLSPVA